MRFYGAVCTKEIFFQNKARKQGERIFISKDEMLELSQAGVIGDVTLMPDPEARVETADRAAPENAMRTHRRKR